MIQTDIGALSVVFVKLTIKINILRTKNLNAETDSVTPSKTRH